MICFFVFFLLREHFCQVSHFMKDFLKAFLLQKALKTPFVHRTSFIQSSTHFLSFFLVAKVQVFGRSYLNRRLSEDPREKFEKFNISGPFHPLNAAMRTSLQIHFLRLSLEYFFKYKDFYVQQSFFEGANDVSPPLWVSYKLIYFMEIQGMSCVSHSPPLPRITLIY